MNILFIIEVKFLVLVNWPYRSLQLCWLLSLEWLPYFEYAVQFHSNIAFWYMFLELHQTTYHLKLGVLEEEEEEELQSLEDVVRSE